MDIELKKIQMVDLERCLKKGSYKTLNDLKRKVTTVIVNEVFDKYNFKKKKIIRKILARTKRATYKNQVAKIKTKSTYPIDFMKLSPDPSVRDKKTNPVPTVEIFKGRRQTVKSLTGFPAFLGKNKKGKTKIWIRDGKKRNQIKVARLNMTVADMISDDLLEQKYIQAFNRLYPARFEYFLNREIEKEIARKK